jgi:PelA/Pel-15E family pectate lyase
MIKRLSFMLMLFCLIISTQASRSPASSGAGKTLIVVAADGSGDAKTVQEAINLIPENNQKRRTLSIKAGVYKEQVNLPANKPYVTFRGEKAETTILTFNLSNKDVGSTSGSYSTYIGGHDFSAENLTFENSFGTGSQAVAILVEADRSVFTNCRFLAWQDTLYAKGGRQYYRDCYIEGHVDFIFGAATAVFENCHIHSKGAGYVTAHMRFSDAEPTGYVFRHCRLTGENTGAGVYLGRPWRPYGRVIFAECDLGEHIKGEGWNNWNDPAREQTARFAEYKSKGKGANPGARVGWSRQLNELEAKAFTTENFLQGTDGWHPEKADFAWQLSHPPIFKLVSWSHALRQKAEWYATDEATRIADQLLLYQHDNGGWSKNLDMAVMLSEKARAEVAKNRANSDTTIDNGSTYTQLAYLAKVIHAKNLDRHRAAFLKGLDFLLMMQYDNGGFPQFFPLRKDYSRHITFNDDAMIGVLRLLRDTAEKRTEFAFVDEERRLKAEQAVQKGIRCLLKTQIVANGKRTVWCAQHDEVTLAPAGARAYELPSFSGSESVGIVEFLMAIKNPAPEISEAIEGAIAWFQSARLSGIRWLQRARAEAVPNGIEHYVVKDDKAPPLWARFYKIETNRPIFVGRDGVIRYDVMEIEAERRNGYQWYVESPNRLLKESYPQWQKLYKPAPPENRQK